MSRKSINFIRLRSLVPRCVEFVYVDRTDYQADAIFAKHGIAPVFRKTQMHHPDWEDYCLVFCRVIRKHETACYEVFRELEKKMLILGYTDYAAPCEFLYQIYVERDG